MEILAERLTVVPNRHRTALQWFVAHSGTECGWPEPLFHDGQETLLATRAKGIYKPAWSRYALSVRQTLGGTYPDLDPIVRPDGSWLYPYFQENEDPTSRDDEYTNRGLVECWHDRIPIGVLRQVKSKPEPRYLVLGVALVAGWDGGYFFLEGFGANGQARLAGPATEIEFLSHSEQAAIAQAGAFDPVNVVDGRQRVIAQIVRRRGQPQFRKGLLEAYAGCCAFSDCDAEEALEAAHIVPYQGDATHHPSNGLLLRADLHTLFDLGLLSVNTVTMTVLVSQELASTTYVALAGRAVRLPLVAAYRPSIPALDYHRSWAGL